VVFGVVQVVLVAGFGELAVLEVAVLEVLVQFGVEFGVVESGFVEVGLEFVGVTLCVDVPGVGHADLPLRRAVHAPAADDPRGEGRIRGPGHLLAPAGDDRDEDEQPRTDQRDDHQRAGHAPVTSP
jgi:hypothetical protein